MNLIVDEQLPRQLVDLFDSWGLEAAWSPDVFGRGTPDETIWQSAISTHAVIVTKDRDYLNFNRTQNRRARILLLSVGNLRTTDLLALISGQEIRIQSWLETNDRILELTR